MGKLAQTWTLMGSSWEVLRRDKELLVFPLLSGVACLAVLAAFALPVIGSYDAATPPPNRLSTHQIALGFMFYFCTYFVLAFFNAGIIACALVRMRGRDPTVRDGLRAAWSRVVIIAEWALVAATVGMVLRMIEGSSRRLGRFMSGVLGAAWSVGTFLVVPILVAEGVDPLGAIRESATLLKKTWGQQLVGGFSFGLVTMLLAIPGIGLLLLGLRMATASLASALCVLAMGAGYVILLSLIQSVLQTVFQAAVYAYAREECVAPGFDRHLLDGSFGV